jgi:hypothetical protein
VFRSTLLAVAALAVPGTVSGAALAQAANRHDVVTMNANVSFLRVIRVTQAPYKPVAFRIWVKAPVGHHLFVGYKIYDDEGNGVFSGDAGQALVLPYYSTTLTLKWNKVAYDGSRLPKGQHFRVIATASDLDTRQKLFRSSLFGFTLA